MLTIKMLGMAKAGHTKLLLHRTGNLQLQLRIYVGTIAFMVTATKEKFQQELTCNQS